MTHHDSITLGIPRKHCFVWFRVSQSDIIATYHSWTRVDPPTTSENVSHPLWTKSGLRTLPRRSFRPETILLSPFLTLEKSVCVCMSKTRTCSRDDEYLKISNCRQNSICHLASLLEAQKSKKNGGLEWLRVATVAFLDPLPP